MVPSTRHLVSGTTAAIRHPPPATLLALALAGAGLLAMPVSTAAAPAQARPGVPARAVAQSTGECTAGWRVVAAPASAFETTPFEVVLRSRRPAWALGGSRRGQVMLRWRTDGLVDARMGTRGLRGLLGGTITRADFLVGVGYRRPSTGGLGPVAGRASAGGWRDESTQTGGARTTLTDVVLRGGRPWAVGTRYDRGRPRAIALRRLRDGWRRADPPRRGAESALTAAARSPDGSLWAVGWRSTSSGRRRPLIVRREGADWSVVEGPRLPAGDAVLTDVAFGGARQGWAVGYLRADGGSIHRPLLLRWDGRGWRERPLPWPEDASVILRSVSVGGDGRLWLAGTSLAGEGREAHGSVAEQAGSGWAVTELAVPDEVRSELHAVAGTADGAVAVGAVGGTSIFIERCPLEAAGDDRRRIAVGHLRARRSVREIEDADDGPRTKDPAAAALEPLGTPIVPEDFEVRDVAASVGLETSSVTYGGLVADLDGDGWTDVFYSRHGGRVPGLYLGGPQGFREVRSPAFSVLDRHGCAAADVDSDGWSDILCAVGRSRGTAIHRHELSLAPAGDTARLAPGALGAADPFGRGLRAAFIHLDGDEYPELLVTTAPDRVDGLPGPDRFFRNLGGRFVPAPGVGLDRHVGSRCALAADIDGDGDEDLLTCPSQPDDGRGAGLRIHRNDSGTLRDRSRALGVRPIGDLDVVVADLTGDGRPDLAQLGPGRLRISRGTSDGFVLTFEARVREGVALAAGDVDGDGRPDLYIATGGSGNRPDRLLLNRRRARRFVSVRIPQADGGRGDDVLALDQDRNGRADFLVLNGQGSTGPVQLLATFPR